MKNNKLKLVVFAVAISPLFAWSSLASASEVTGTLSTGVGGTTGNTVEGVVIAPPTASPATGVYSSSQSVTLAAVGVQSIHYTTDGTVPTCTSGSVYSSPIAVSASKTIKAISCYPNGISSSATSLAYTIAILPDQLPSLLANGTFSPPAGSSANSTPSVSVTQKVVIDVSNAGGTSAVTLPAGTVITSTSGQNFDATALTASAVNSTSLSGLGTGAVVDGALQWGIANLGLQFSTPITLEIFVGSSFNGQTLSVLRSTSGGGDWTDEGIVPPATCLVANGICSFTATKASYYAVTHTVAVSSGGGSGSGGGGGGGSGGESNRGIILASALKGDADGNGKVDVLDFNVLMVNWGKTNANNVADFNGDGKVDIFDFNLLMVNWTK